MVGMPEGFLGMGFVSAREKVRSLIWLGPLFPESYYNTEGQ